MMKNAKLILQDYALNLGFCITGFARVEKIEDRIQKYKKWLESGYNAGMKYLENHLDKREDPATLHPGARTLVMLAMSYNNGIKRPENINYRTSGKISRYAWGSDYHDIIKEKLKLFSAKIVELFPEANNRYFVDTGPILEKYWAEKSGIGWQGKNGLIINKKFGSYLFLGTLLTNIEFDPGHAAKDLCGKCDDCLKACPTKAITDIRTIDASKCISYWTIEVKPDIEIPDHMAKNMNGWLFGCDDCQDACPWNRKARTIQNEDFLPRNGETVCDFEYVENLSAEDFSSRFRKSPVKRTKLAGLKRNIRALKK